MSKISPPRASKSTPRAKSSSTGPQVTNFIETAPLDDTTRRAMIAEAAYYRAERRGFAPGFELEDWLVSENELDAQIQSQSLDRTSSGEMH